MCAANRSPNILQTVLSSDVQQILDQFRECFGVRIVLYDVAGTLLKSGMDQGDCRYCMLVQRLYGPEKCSQETATGRERSSREGLVCYQCHAGLKEAAFPIYGDGFLLGYAMIGQMRSSRQLPRKVARDWNQKFGTNAIRKAFLAQQHVSNHHIDSILGLFSILAKYVVSNHLVAAKIDQKLVQALNYMREHIHETVTLKMLAQHLGVNYSYLSRSFSTSLGVPFKHVLIEMKMTRAEEIMASEPKLAIAAIAERVGYDDPFYFSRIYQKYRGKPPSEFRVSHDKNR